MVVLTNSFAGEDAGAPAPAKRRSKQSSCSAGTYIDVDGSSVFRLRLCRARLSVRFFPWQLGYVAGINVDVFVAEVARPDAGGCFPIRKIYVDQQVAALDRFLGPGSS
jgi:hypothetical protein